MALVKVKGNFQVTIPNSLREQVGLNVGDVLEAKVHRGSITLTPRSDIDERLAEGLKDLEDGHSSGPYSNVAEAQHAFERRAGSKKRTKPGR